MRESAPYVRPARTDEAPLLTALSIASKSYWHYPRAYLSQWQEELTITGSYIEDNRVYVLVEKDMVAGYYSLVYLAQDRRVAGDVLERGHWLEHMFVDPRLIGRGYGRSLASHLVRTCRQAAVPRLLVLADPHARGFYERQGWQYLREFPSSIAGRTTPLLQLCL